MFINVYSFGTKSDKCHVDDDDVNDDDDDVTLTISILLIKKNREKTDQKKMTGQSRVAAKLNAAWASPSEAAPSPK